MILNLKYEISKSHSLLDCIISTIKSALPIITWLPQYNLSDAISDLIAGVTVGLTVIPQGIDKNELGF